MCDFVVAPTQASSSDSVAKLIHPGRTNQLLALCRKRGMVVATRRLGCTALPQRALCRLPQPMPVVRTRSMDTRTCLGKKNTPRGKVRQSVTFRIAWRITTRELGPMPMHGSVEWDPPVRGAEMRGARPRRSGSVSMPIRTKVVPIIDVRGWSCSRSEREKRFWPTFLVL